MSSEQCVECGYDVDRNEIHECPPFKKRPSSNTDANKFSEAVFSMPPGTLTEIIQEHRSLTAELSDYRALVDAAVDRGMTVGPDDCVITICWGDEGRVVAFDKDESEYGQFESALDAFKSLQAENKS